MIKWKSTVRIETKELQNLVVRFCSTFYYLVYIIHYFPTQCTYLSTCHVSTCQEIFSFNAINSSDPIPILSVAAVAVKLLIEQITRYCTLMLRSLQGKPCLTFSFEYRDCYTYHWQKYFPSATAHIASHPYNKTPEDRSIWFAFSQLK